MDLNDETYDRLISQIFSAALDGSQWQVFLDSLRRVSNGVQTHVFGHDLSKSDSVVVGHSGYGEEYLESWNAYFGARNVWAPGIFNSRVGQSLPIASFYPDEALVKTEFYNDWVLPQEDLRAGGGAVLVKSSTRFFAIGGNIRAKDAERLEAPFLELVQRLTPHLQAALAITRRIGALEVENNVLAQAGAGPGGAVLVLDAARSVVYANAVGQAQLADGTHLRCDMRGRAAFADPVADRRLAIALGQLNQPGTGAGAAVFRLSGPGPSMTCRTARLDLPDLATHPALLLTRALDAPCLLLTLARDFSASQAHRALIANHALTTAEADIAVGVTEGHGLAELAEARGTSLHTVRNQLKAVLSKTGQHSQRDLVRLVIHLGS